MREFIVLLVCLCTLMVFVVSPNAFSDHISELEDTDSDGMPDEWERGNGFWNNKPGVNEGVDNDGLSNLEEYNHGTDPWNADSNGDGLSDGWEVENNLDATRKDANLDHDKDSLLTSAEYRIGTDPH